jgi:capsular polysaccharide biosynthesis protein
MSPESSANDGGTAEITLKQLIGDLKSARLWIVLAAVLCAAAFGAYGEFSKPEYEVSTIVVPVTSDASNGISGGLSSLASQYGGLASLAGLSIGGGSKAPEYVAVLQSEYLTESYIESKNLLPVLYANRWDQQLHRWKDEDPKKRPTLWKANQFFKKNIRSVSEEKATGIVTLRIRWTDPAAAAAWANDLVALTNDYLRNKAIAESERNIAYLSDAAAKTNVVDLKQNIYLLLQREINNEMVAKGREAYALKVLDPAYRSEKPTSFGATTLTIFGFIVGVVGSFMLLLFRRVIANA